ncbi:MAG TPA: PKD domain-containing protein [Nitriliruptoraceae bacterium]|nr:PKD domain-containing protein [Nitriliruptoraceae bacterium]
MAHIRARGGRRAGQVLGSSVVASAMLAVVAFPAGATHPDETTSTAIYRIPYADGILVDVIGDAHNHGGTNGSRDRIDMVAYDDNAGTRTSPSPGPAVAGDGTALIVAAASGRIAVIQDSHGNDYGRGDGLAFDGTQQLGGGNDNLEHSCRDATEDSVGNNDGVLDPIEDLDGDGINDPVPGITVVGRCSQHNNYVWVAHPNGEWTKYSHFRTGTVTTDAGWAVGDTVLVGQVLGEEGDVGFAGSTHLHFEVANLGTYASYDADGSGIVDPGELPNNIGNAGGFISGAFQNDDPRVCDATTADYSYVDDNDATTTITAGQCVNTAPTSDAGGPYEVFEGSTQGLDGSASSDPHNALLSYSWSPGTNLDDPTIATPTYDATGLDDAVEVITLTVSDAGGDVSAGEAITDDADATVTVLNVAPSVTAVGDQILEGEAATVTATFDDPGVLDTHTATIDWDDGTAPEPVDPAGLAGGVDHVYGDNGTFDVTVTVTDDDGGVGADGATVTVDNVDPLVALDTGDTITFPGGDFFVVMAGDPLALAADGTDDGSDDLTFAWNTEPPSIHFNDGVGPDPFPSPLGTFPFAASDATAAIHAAPGAETVMVTLTDDDGGTTQASAGVLVTGTADDTQAVGWWKHQYADAGKPHIDADTAAGYLEVVDAASGIFSEDTPLSFDQVGEILSPSPGDARDRATADLLVAWLQFASGAVDIGADVPLAGGASAPFLDLLFEAEAIIANPAASDAALHDVELQLKKVRHAG